MNRRAFLASLAAAPYVLNATQPVVNTLDPYISYGSLGKIRLIVTFDSPGPVQITWYGTEATLLWSEAGWELHRKDGAYFCSKKFPTTIESIPEE